MRNVKKEEKEDANKLNKKHHQGGIKKEKEINKDELHKKITSKCLDLTAMKENIADKKSHQRSKFLYSPALALYLGFFFISSEQFPSD